MLGLRFCGRASSSSGKRGPLLIAVRGPLTIAASPVAEHRLQTRSTGSRRAGSVIVAHGPSRSAACGIPPDQGSNPCPLHWQADSQPLRHQGSPYKELLKFNDKRASLVAQWLRICLPMQGTRVRALVWEDPTCCGATGPVSHNY